MAEKLVVDFHTRCVRFITEVSGVEQFGLSGRGNRMEIGTYVQQNLTSELSGNIVDLCPVGALTSKPYQFKGRPWELKNVESVDLSDGVGSNIRIDTRGNELLRVLPRMNNAINEEWISDKTRHAVVDGSRNQRIDCPAMLTKENGWRNISWQQLLTDLAVRLSRVNGQDIAFYVDTTSNDVETMLMIKDLAHSVGSPNLFTYSGVHGSLDIDGTFREKYTCSFADLEKADVCLFIGVNPRKEASMLNVRLRKRVLKGELLVASIGLSENLTYPCTHLGGTFAVLLQVLEGRHVFCKVLAKAKNPVIIVGADTMWSASNHGKVISALQSRFRSVHIMHGTSNGVGALDIGFVSSGGIHAQSGMNGKFEVAYVFGGLATANHSVVKVLSNTPCVIYQGSHGQNLPNLCYIVPGAVAATEKQGFFVNTEGRVQETKMAITAAKEDWKIVRALISAVAQQKAVAEPVGSRSLQDIRARLVQQIAPHFVSMHLPAERTSVIPSRLIHRINVYNYNIVPAVINFYQTDCLSSHSKIMADCTKMIRDYSHNYSKK